jgi:hypothetical protein
VADVKPAASPAPGADVSRLRSLVTGYFLSRALYAVTALDVAEALAKGSLSADELASRTGAHAPSLNRVLRALAPEGVFTQDEQGRYGNTALSELLRANVPGSLRDLILLLGDETSWRSWEAIVDGIRTGQAPFEQIYGEKFFDYLQDHHDTAAMFDRAMTSASGTTNAAVIEAYDFSGMRHLVDVGGNLGAALCSILQAFPDLRGTVFDLPHIASRAREFIAALGLDMRCDFAGGSFFESIPGGADGYFMKHILHDWGDVECVQILTACRRAMGPDARLLICERIVPTGNAPSPAKVIDLHMFMTNHGGMERTEAEYRLLLERSGLRLACIVNTSTPWSLLEARLQ